MTTIKLLKSILDDGIKRTNFYNGRILTADDLKKEQEACNETNRRTNIAAGEGVVYGLEVRSGGTTTDPVVSIDPGMAISRSGSTLYLGRTADIKVITKNEVISSSIFNNCGTKQDFLTGFGAYLLIISPASDYEGYVSTNTIPPAAGGSNCGRKYITEGVQFGLVKVNPGFISCSSLYSKLAQCLEGTSEEDKQKTRNLLAHLCFGTQDKKGFYLDPFFEYNESATIRDAEYGLIEAMRKERYLTDDDVPLALLLWTKNGLSFLDMWHVRRKTERKTPAGDWHLFLGERNPAESEACFLQFQSQIDDIIKNKETALNSISAVQYFSFLPSFGMIPVQVSYIQSYMIEFGNESYMNELKNKKISFINKPGFHPPTFFKGMICRQPVIIEGAKFEAAMRESLSYPPVDLSYPPVDTESGEFLWLYLVRENIESVFNGTGIPYMIFASGHMPYIGDARYDLARWDYSNYSSGNDNVSEWRMK